MRTLTISLTEQQASRLQQAVQTGAYASNSEVVRDALRLWEQHQEMRTVELEHLKRAYDQGMASGEARLVNPGEFLAELKSERRKRG